MLLRISSNYFVAGVVLNPDLFNDWVVRKCAPILHYMNSWKLEKVFEYCTKKGWKVEQLNYKEKSHAE
jgi:hypothetical protein